MKLLVKTPFKWSGHSFKRGHVLSDDDSARLKSERPHLALNCTQMNDGVNLDPSAVVKLSDQLSRPVSKDAPPNATALPEKG